MKSVAFVIDYPEYHGGAHVATFALIDRMREDGYKVDVVSPDIPNAGIRYQLFRFFKHSHIGWYPTWLIDPRGSVRQKLSGYDSVCCLGEASISRKLVAYLPATTRKVLFIHTDYTAWKQYDMHSKEYCRFDRWWYKKYDCIGVIGKNNANKMAHFFPELRERILPFHNIFNETKTEHGTINGSPIQIISIIRVGDIAKRTDRYVSAAKYLFDAGIKFNWSIYGGGDKLEFYRKKVNELHLSDFLHFYGHIDNIKEKIKDSDLMVMLSNYEGLPNSIYESLLCGTPVFSTNVGGVSEQIQDGITGWLVDNDDDLIFKYLLAIVTDPKRIAIANSNLMRYNYDNETAYAECCSIILGKLPTK